LFFHVSGELFRQRRIAHAMAGLQIESGKCHDAQHRERGEQNPSAPIIETPP